MDLQIRLLGAFELTADTPNSTNLACRKAQELISYLLLVGRRTTTRELAVESIWPDCNPETGRKQIRQALWNIHQSLDDPEDDNRFIVATGDCLSVNPDRARWCDAVEFAAALDSVMAQPDGDLDDALGLYRGALLQGWYSDWCIVERERLETLYLLGLDEAATRAEQRGDRWRSVAWSHALLRIDPAHERTHRRLMRLYYGVADRTRALQQFDRCRRVLQTELGVSPSTRTVELYRTIRDDASTPAIESGLGATGSSDATGRSDGLVEELTGIRRCLESLQRSLGN